MEKRIVEVFVAGCPCCDEAVQLVKSLTCDSCDIRVLDMRSDRAAQGRATQVGVKRVPAVAVDGQLAECCQGGVSAVTLREHGVGSRL